MSRRTIRTIILFATISVIGITAFQLFWVRQAFNLEEEQFNNRVHVALTNVVEEVQQLNRDSSELYEPIKQITTNYFLVETNDTLHPFLLESLLKNEFTNRNIDTDFEYVIYDCFTDSIVFGNYVDLEAEEKSLLYRTSNNDNWENISHYFGVYFPEKNSYVVNKLGIWIFSTVFLAIVVLFFGYTIYVMLRHKRLSEIKTDFINNMTHELKTPISTISLSAEVLADPEIGQNPDRLGNYARIIKEESDRLQNQVDKVLQMASLEKKKMNLEKEKVNIHELIRRCIEGFELIIEERQGVIEKNLKASDPYVKGDKTHLMNILFNLVDNAVKYSKDAPTIEISTEDTKNGFYLRVKDQGIGISREQQKQVFEKFYRVPTGDVHDTKGFGIGLDYVKKMVKIHGGKIRLKSQPNVGTTFRIYFPSY